MKNLLFLLSGLLFLAACKDADNKAAPAQTAAPVAKVSKNTTAFNESFHKMLGSYYELKDALVEVDTAKANTASRKLAADAESLKITELKTDTAVDIRETAKNYAATVAGSALGFAGETDYPKKKKEFQMISDAMYDLVRTVKYDREKLYHQHCPMAINDNEEAYWLSNQSNILNPYLGKKHPKFKNAMLECGDVTDSLDFSN